MNMQELTPTQIAIIVAVIVLVVGAIIFYVAAATVGKAAFTFRTGV